METAVSKVFLYIFSILIALASCHGFMLYWMWQLPELEHESSDLENGFALFATGIVFAFIAFAVHLILHILIFVHLLHRNDHTMDMKRLLFRKESSNNAILRICLLIILLIWIVYATIVHTIPLFSVISFTLVFINYSIWLLQFLTERRGREVRL
ncbi:hypothetical protein [Paenibacillus sp. 23TSA30-6]|uniref:hypothetical protein n=1 Tax=Paenibacillus sp. 23TSA30-6 TaxID=2546104 RepID=UPI0017885FAE|nr:hypothetical protein [Paenibacillus sp. 23TSA30-6]MBE0337154.1 hypothetical protein [Paenibacillus sp. 23TSA30-6]